MSEEVTDSYVLRRTYTDVDDLATEARQWSLDFRQLDRGEFHGDVLQFGSHGAHIADARFCRSLYQQGAPPHGLRTVAVPARSDLRLNWRGQSIDGQSLMVFPCDSELSSVSGPEFHVYTCSVPEGLLADAGEALGLGNIDELCGHSEAIQVGPAALEKLRGYLLRVCDSVRHDPTILPDGTVVSSLAQELSINLMTTLASGSDKCPPLAGPKRLAALDRAESFIAHNVGDDISVRDICQASGVSERTLQYAFIEKFSVGPKEYLSALRLCSVRRHLRAADPRTTKVADVANAWGFWHMGQFAADYRERFGELPSETLRLRRPA